MVQSRLGNPVDAIENRDDRIGWQASHGRCQKGQVIQQLRIARIKDGQYEIDVFQSALEQCLILGHCIRIGRIQ